MSGKCRTPFWLAVVALVVLGGLAVRPGAAQGKPENVRLTVFGIGVKNYAESQNFYEKVMGFPVAFRFGSTERPTTYYQMSRDTFLEMQMAAEGAAPSFTHVHLLVDNVAAAVGRLRKAGLGTPAQGAATPMTVSEPGMAQASRLRNANIFDPQGLRLELNEETADSLTVKAAAGWGNRGSGYRLNTVGIGVRDHAAALLFAETVMGFPVIAKFGAADRPTTVHQMSRDTFLELQTIQDGTPSISHVHLLVDSLDATIAQLSTAGLPLVARNVTTPGTISEAGMAGGTRVRNANIVDPNGLRIELNEWSAESLTKKAADAWTGN